MLNKTIWYDYPLANLKGWIIKCPACKGNHIFDSRWKFNNNQQQPSFTPSMLEKCGPISSDNPLNADDYKINICHSFVKDGKIQYLGDCTHHLASQTIDLPTFTDTEEKYYASLKDETEEIFRARMNKIKSTLG